MRQSLLRLLNAPALLLILLFGIAIQTSVFSTYPLMYLQPDLILIVTIWLALKRPFMEGGILTLLLAIISESHSSSPKGLFMMSYMCIFLLTLLASRLFILSSLSSLVYLAMGSSIFWKMTNVIILKLLQTQFSSWRYTLSLLIPGAIVEGIFAVWGFKALEYFDWITYKSPRGEAADHEMPFEGDYN